MHGKSIVATISAPPVEARRVIRESTQRPHVCGAEGPPTKKGTNTRTQTIFSFPAKALLHPHLVCRRYSSSFRWPRRRSPFVDAAIDVVRRSSKALAFRGETLSFRRRRSLRARCAGDRCDAAMDVTRLRRRQRARAPYHRDARRSRQRSV